MFESEFFGHVKGAFTGAFENRAGRFELAHKGTIFLDEISELPLELQTKFLRILQEGQFEKVGEGATQKVDVRVIAATNRSLEEEVKAGRFRADLYYRLNVFPIFVPPLRERIEDVAPITENLLERICQRLNFRKTPIPAEIINRLKEYSWPGNVRELQNILERAMILSQGKALDLALIGQVLGIGDIASIDRKPGISAPLAKESPGIAASSGNFIPQVIEQYNIEQYRRQNILTALQQTNWKISGPRSASELLNLKPTTLLSRMKKLGIEKPW